MMTYNSLYNLFLLLDIYVKVTLYEGGRVIKAKKTRQLSCSEVLDFNEKFSIRLPASYLNNVSCLVSLCSRNKYGLKAVMGRTNVGPFAFANGQGDQFRPVQTSSDHAMLGLEHWQQMIQSGEEVVKWHKMISNFS